MRRFAERWQQHTIIGSAGALLGAAALLPLAWPLIALASGTWGPDSPGLHAISTFATLRPWVLLGRSFGISTAVSCGAMALGVPIGILLARTDIVGRRPLMVAFGAPLFLPPFLLALGWFYLFGRQGYIGSELSASLLFRPIGVTGVLVLAFAPLVASLVTLALWNLDPSLEEAARVVARPARVAVGVLIPAALPSIALAGLLVFALAFSELAVPMFLRVDVYPAAVYSRLGSIDYAPTEAFLLTTPLVLVAISMVCFERWLARRRLSGLLGVRYRSAPPLPLSRWRGVTSAACWLVALVPLMPLAALAARAVEGGGIAHVYDWVGGSLWHSLVGATLGATAIVVLGAILGYGCARRLSGAWFWDWVGLLTFVTPSVLLGVGLIAVWNRPTTGLLYGGLGILVVGYVARYGIVGIRAMSLAVEQSPMSLEQAATVSGATFARRFLYIVVPLHRRSLLAAWFLALVFCLRDVEMAVLYYPPGWQPLTVRIFTLEANGPEPVVAALALVQVVVTGALLAAGAWLLTRRAVP